MEEEYLRAGKQEGLWKEKMMRSKNEATGQKYHFAEEDGMEPVVQGSG